MKRLPGQPPLPVRSDEDDESDKDQDEAKDEDESKDEDDTSEPGYDEEKENDQWEYELRVRHASQFTLFHAHRALQPCGERVLMSLATQYPQYVNPLIQLTFQNLVGM